MWAQAHRQGALGRLGARKSGPAREGERDSYLALLRRAGPVSDVCKGQLVFYPVWGEEICPNEGETGVLCKHATPNRVLKNINNVQFLSYTKAFKNQVMYIDSLVCTN